MPIADVLAGKNCLIDQKFPLCRDLRPSSPITKKKNIEGEGGGRLPVSQREKQRRKKRRKEERRKRRCTLSKGHIYAATQALENVDIIEILFLIITYIKIDTYR